MKCEICGHDLAVLFTSWYCPNEDNHGVKLAPMGDHTVPSPIRGWKWESRDVCLVLYKCESPAAAHLFYKEYMFKVIFPGTDTRPVMEIYLKGDSQDEINDRLRQFRQGDFHRSVSYDLIDCSLVPPRVTWEL